MSGDENKRGRNTRSSIKCDECNRYFLNKEAVDSHKTQFHVTKKGATTAKNTPAKTTSHGSKPSKTNAVGIKLTKVTSPVPENVAKIAKNLIAASKNALTIRNSSLESSTNSPTTKNVAQDDDSKNSAPVNGKSLKEDEIITELSINIVPVATKSQSNRKPVPVSFKNIGFKCPKCSQHFSSYFVALKHIQKRHCTSKGAVDKNLQESLKPIRMGECIQCNEYLSLSSSHTCALQRVKPTSTTTVNMLTNEIILFPTNNENNTIKTYKNLKKSNNLNTNIKNELSPQIVRSKRFSDEVETSVDPIALSEEDEVDPTKLMYVKRNSEFKCWGCHRTFINFDGFNSHVLQNHYEETEIFFVNDPQEFHLLSTLIKNNTGANYKMLEISSQTPGHFFLQCQSRPLIDKSGIAYYCPSSLILEKFGNIHVVAYCKQHFCTTKGKPQIHNVESLLNKRNIDLYLQFKHLTESVIIEAAKVKVSKLTELNVKAKEFAKYLHKINIKDEPVRNVIPNTIQGLNLDEITEYKEDIKPRKRRMTYSDEVKPNSVKKKRNSQFYDNREQSPVHETITTNVIIENHSPKMMNTFKKESPSISVKSVASLNSSVPASFSDTYEHFLKSSSLEPLKNQFYQTPNKSKIRTKLGQFSPKNRDAKSDKPESKKKKKVKTTEKSDSETDTKSNKKTVTFSPVITTVKTIPKLVSHKVTTSKIKPKLVVKKSTSFATKTNVMSPKSSEVSSESDNMSPKPSTLVNKIKPKFVSKKSTALATKTNVLSPKSSDMSSESDSMSPKPSILAKKSKSPVLASPKICIKYEVKEQENDCNILILKI